MSDALILWFDLVSMSIKLSPLSSTSPWLPTPSQLSDIGIKHKVLYLAKTRTAVSINELRDGFLEKRKERESLSSKSEWLHAIQKLKKLSLQKNQWLYALHRRKTTFLSGTVGYEEFQPPWFETTHLRASACRHSKFNVPSTSSTIQSNSGS